MIIYGKLLFKTFPVLLKTFASSITKIMGKDIELTGVESKLLNEVRKIIPILSEKLYKGQAGRIGVIGGSLEYTGAPYFSAISALKVGCDLSHVFCPKDAAAVIKSYSPELIVHPVLDASNAVELIKPWIPRLHTLVIGPGLGRDPKHFVTVSTIINMCRCGESDFQKPLVIDADGLFLITQKPDVIQNYPHGAILTPNAIEFTRLAKAYLNENWVPSPEPNIENVKKLASALGPNIVIVHKGRTDIIVDGSNNVWQCSGPGTGRRCGGQGDLLSGSLGTFYTWALMFAQNNKCPNHQFPPGVVASFAGCRLTRECNVRAYARAGRSTVTTDMIEEIHPAFENLFGE